MQQIGERLVQFIGRVVKVSLILLCLILIPVLVCILLSAMGFLVASCMALAGKTMDLLALFPYFDWNMIRKAPFLFVGGGVVVMFITGLPLLITIHFIRSYFGKADAFSIGTKITLFVMWLIAWIVLGLLSAHAVALGDMRLL